MQSRIENNTIVSIKPRYLNERRTCFSVCASLFSSFTCLFVVKFSHAATPASTNLVIENRVLNAASAPASQWSQELFIEPKTIRPSAKTLRARIEAEKKKPDIAEPIVLRLRTTELRPLLAQLANDTAFRAFTSSISSSHFSFLQDLEKRLDKKTFDSTEDANSTNVQALLTLNPTDLSWIDLEKLSHALAYPSIEVFLPSDEITALRNGEPQTLGRWNLHFGVHFNQARNHAERWLESHPRDLQMPLRELLPEHMRNLLGRYSPFRGRNCFATALQFADPNVIQAKNINLVREAGHSLALINNDEFSHALWLGYDELRPFQVDAGLQFGDLIAVVDNDEGRAYTAFKHAAIHVAADIYFHKPSKSASSPIEFIRWRDLVQTWSPLVKQFEVRYFRRRTGTHLQERGSNLAIENINWNR